MSHIIGKVYDLTQANFNKIIAELEAAEKAFLIEKSRAEIAEAKYGQIHRLRTKLTALTKKHESLLTAANGMSTALILHSNCPGCQKALAAFDASQGETK